MGREPRGSSRMQTSICNAFTAEPSNCVGGGLAVAVREENVF